VSHLSPAGILETAIPLLHLARNPVMPSNKTPWFINSYVIIIIVCVMLAIFIWFLFKISISELDKKSKEPVPKNQTVLNKAVYEKTDLPGNRHNFYATSFNWSVGSKCWN
jgi:hypothetical protein